MDQTRRNAMRWATVGGAAVGVLAPLPVLAHVGHEQHGRFVDGFSHPMLGLDHLLAMVAVGVLATLLRRPLLVPVAFVVALVAGALLGLGGLGLPMVEVAIASSVVGLGATLALGARLHLAAAASLVALAGVLHGNAHGLETPATRPAVFMIGFVVATVGLHAAGVAIGVLARTRPSARSALAAGVAAAGIGLIAGLA